VKLPFVKMHGCANDFVLVEAGAPARPARAAAGRAAGNGAGRDGAGGPTGVAAPDAGAPATAASIDWAALAGRVCDRRRGVGADGLLVVTPPSAPGAADARMATINPDGSESEMCGNGLRCLARFLFDRGRAGREMRVETLGGVVALRVEKLDGRGRAAEISLTIGVPEFARARVPMAGPPDVPALDEPFDLSGRTLRVSALRLGNPHCVTFVEDLEGCPVQSLGPALERDPRFPQRVNVEFVQVLGPDELAQRTWERGVGETPACGSGATAAAIVARKVLGFGPDVRVRLVGGELRVHWPGDGKPARLTGPAVEVFEGSLDA
jgi:diaminopimelate epimerase